jgi:quinol monooxygenase YgiN
MPAFTMTIVIGSANIFVDPKNARDIWKAIHNGQSRETGNIGYTWHRTKTYKKVQKTRKDEQHRSHSFHSDAIAVEFTYTLHFNL